MRTAYLGQFTDDVANAIAEEFEHARIWWTYKQAGRLTQVFFAGEWGTRLFVDEARLEDARQIAARVVRRSEG